MAVQHWFWFAFLFAWASHQHQFQTWCPLWALLAATLSPILYLLAHELGRVEGSASGGELMFRVQPDCLTSVPGRASQSCLRLVVFKIETRTLQSLTPRWSLCWNSVFMLTESMGCQPQLGDKKFGFWCWARGWGERAVTVEWGRDPQQPLAAHPQISLWYSRMKAEQIFCLVMSIQLGRTLHMWILATGAYHLAQCRHFTCWETWGQSTTVLAQGHAAYSVSEP